MRSLHMEVLHILEEKIARLIESKKKDMALIVELKKEISFLQDECKGFKETIEKMEAAFLAYNKNESAFSQERENARLAVDELIVSIDELIEEELRS